jgi:PadR family transcriptional regulator, regulatory protein PadR
MDPDSIEVAWRPNRHSRFEVAAPRRFLFPALMLLIAEEPQHGYGLAKKVHSLHLGRVDRPSVYRALAELESDGLVMSCAETGRAGHTRRSYRITEEGEHVLRRWMGVIKDERDGLDRVLRRYVATESLEAKLAEVAGGWQRVTVPLFSPVSPSSGGDGTFGRLGRLRSSPVADVVDDVDPVMSHYEVVPDRSVVLIDARSSVGPITFGAIGLHGWIDASITGDRIREGTSPSAHLEIEVNQLRSGNGLYDAELIRRIEGRRYPTVSIDLRNCREVGSTGKYLLQGDVNCHGTTRPLEGSVEMFLSSPNTLGIRGEQTLDIRDFGVVSPMVLMLRIYPDVLVKIQIEAELRQ